VYFKEVDCEGEVDGTYCERFRWQLLILAIWIIKLSHHTATELG
jgi:hypothetical protein